MVPTLNKQDIQDRIASAMKVGSGETAKKVLRKRKLNGTNSVDIKMKQKIGKLMNSTVAPKTGLEGENA